MVGKSYILKPKIVVVGNAVISNSVISLLKDKVDLIQVKSDKLKETLENNDSLAGVWIHFETYLDQGYKKYLENVKYLISSTTGLTHIANEIQHHFGENLICLRNRLSFLPSISSTAEHAWALVMLGQQDLNVPLQHVKSGSWDRVSNLRDKQLSSQNLGVIGFGRLGSMVANYGRAFGMTVRINDIKSDAIKSAKHEGFEVIPTIEQLLVESDIVSIHANFENGNSPIITNNVLDLIDKPLLLVNTSRAGLVDEDAILQEIERKQHLRYFTDVLSCEEYGSEIQESKLWEKSLTDQRIKITPHIGGATKEAITLCEEELMRDLLRRLFVKN
jgi:D-3-phosphoglycerate dehydrogenase